MSTNIKWIRIGFIGLILILFGFSAGRAAGELDPTFNPSVFGVGNGTISVIRKQPDGKFLVGGTFIELNGQATVAVARLNADGTVDSTFSSPEFGNGSGVGGAVLAIGVQSDGKIVVGGDIYGVNNVNAKKIYRLNPDGSLDPTFQSPLFDSSSNGIVYDIEVQPDDKIVAGGQFNTTIGGATSNFMRLNANGTVDPSFAGFSTVGTINNVELQPDGKILTAGSTVVRRTTDGSVDGTFAAPGLVSAAVYALRLQPDGRILIGGQFNTVNGFNQGSLARLNADGSLDINFNLNNAGANGLVNDILLASDGKIVITGFFTTFNATARQKVARLNADGTLDPTFQNNPQFANLFAKDAEFFADGKLLVGGGVQAGPTPSLVRLNTDGTLDTTILFAAATTGKVREILRQPDGKILVAGQFSAINGVRRNAVARLNEDGTLDTGFVPYFNTSATQQIYNALVLQPDGKIVAGGGGNLPLVRMNADGSQDTSFASGLSSAAGIVDLALTTGGQLLVGGDALTSTRRIARLNANGTIDNSFAVNQPNGAVYRIDLQSDGKMFIGGAFTQIGTTNRGRIAKLNADGTVDTSFNPPGGANGDVYNTAVQTDGKIILSGVFTGLNGSLNQQRIGRLNADGSLDTGFVQAANGSVNALRIQPDGKILIGGGFSTIGGNPRIGLARLNADGSLDNTLTTNVPLGVVDIQLQPDGKILIGGDFIKVNGVSHLRLARLLNASAPPRHYFDYDGDGKADVSVFRASENKWYILRSSDFGVTQTVFAIANDIPVPADYDGDGKTDVAIFRPSSGSWWYLSSINNAQINVNFGQAGDIPRPSDFDGDGKTDFIVFRPSNSVWYRFSATGQTSIIAFGAAGDQPVTGDFDGDGKSDPAIYRPSTGDWWYASSITGQFLATHWGQTGDVPAPADFDGDGKTDFAIFRPSDGGWFVSKSAGGGFISTSFGTLGDKPIPADYDGDGKADIAVFRPSTGIWYLLQTTAGFGAVQWGIATDTPTENAFIP
ncbi:MAG: VCBS repeat-containing protein [Acidobacteria bacterium]|nr:VCBS repeat-containing protein [Acidobacteriota bacterium]